LLANNEPVAGWKEAWPKYTLWLFDVAQLGLGCGGLEGDGGVFVLEFEWRMDGWIDGGFIGTYLVLLTVPPPLSLFFLISSLIDGQGATSSDVRLNEAKATDLHIYIHAQPNKF
jgi:hypothetical protein